MLWKFLFRTFGEKNEEKTLRVWCHMTSKSAVVDPPLSHNLVQYNNTKNSRKETSTVTIFVKIGTIVHFDDKSTHKNSERFRYF